MLSLKKYIYILGTCLLASMALAQNGADSTSVDVIAPTPNAGQLSDVSQVRELGGANFLTSNFGLKHWGPLTLGTTEVIQAYSSADSGSSILLSEIQSNLVAQRQFSRSHLVFQYSPKVTVANGEFLKNFANQDLDLNTAYLLSPRLSLAVSDHFQTFNTNYLDGGSFFSTDSFTSTSTQQAFLQGNTPSRYLNDSIQASVGYAINATTHFTVAPSYSYSRASGLATPLVSNTYGATFSVEHALNATRNVGAFYSRESIHIEQHGSPFVTPYDNVGLSYSQQISPTWGITGSLGAFREGLPGGTRWSGSGNISTNKSFGKSSIGLAFVRAEGLAGVITNRTSNRVDAIYRYPLSRRLHVDIGSGYAAVQDAGGLYTTFSADFEMQPTVSWFASYSFKNQRGDGDQIGTLISNFVMVGLRWHPRQPAH
jgi:hypothetical protein